MESKLSIIGAGSNYTPVVIEFLLRRHIGAFPFDRIALMDISPERLETTASFVRHQLEKREVASQVTLHGNMRAALEKASVVITIYRVGGLAARHHDTRQAIELGVLGQETQGWGGFASALRNIPVAVEISQLMKEVNPNGWLLNITNPVGIITQACQRIRPERVLGICEIPIRMLCSVRKALNPAHVDRDFSQVDLDELGFDFSYVGLNHLSWITSVVVDDVNIIDTILVDAIEDILAGARSPNIPDSDSLTSVARDLRAIPSPYLRYYYLNDKMIRAIRRSPKTRAEICMEIDESLMGLYKAPDATEGQWLEVAKRRGGFRLGPTVAAVVEQMLGPSGKLIIPCVRNNSTMPFLPQTAVIEAPTRMEAESWTSEAIPTFHPRIHDLIAEVASYEELTVEAGITGDRETALRALVTNPLIRSKGIAEKLIDETLTANKKFLPQFE